MVHDNAVVMLSTNHVEVQYTVAFLNLQSNSPPIKWPCLIKLASDRLHVLTNAGRTISRLVKQQYITGSPDALRIKQGHQTGFAKATVNGQ